MKFLGLQGVSNFLITRMPKVWNYRQHIFSKRKGWKNLLLTVSKGKRIKKYCNLQQMYTYRAVEEYKRANRSLDRNL